MTNRLLLTGLNLTRPDFYDVALENRPVGLHPDARRAMSRSRALIDRVIAERKVVYAVPTGVGSLSTEHIEPEKARELQLNIVRSHACGVGESLEPAETRGLLLLRANGLARGLSGVRPAVAELLCEFLNRGVHPVVPSRGSVGASGDLAPLAHVALALVGEGRVNLAGKLQHAGPALKRLGLKALTLEAKEGVSLINGTQAMLSLG